MRILLQYFIHSVYIDDFSLLCRHFAISSQLGGYVTKNCVSQVLEHYIEQSRTGGHPAVTYLCKNIPKRSLFYVITKNRSCLNVLNLALYRSF